MTGPSPLPHPFTTTTTTTTTAAATSERQNGQRTKLPPWLNTPIVAVPTTACAPTGPLSTTARCTRAYAGTVTHVYGHTRCSNYTFLSYTALGEATEHRVTYDQARAAGSRGPDRGTGRWRGHAR
jgi:hypothetical protein